MNQFEAKALATTLAKLFPMQVTDAQLKLCVSEFQKHPTKTVEAAIAGHRRTRDKIDWKEFYRECETSVPDVSANETWADVRRRQNQAFRGKGDFEVVLRVHRGWWHACSQSDGSRTQLQSSCANQLAAHGMEAEAAKRWTATIFEPSPDYFREVLEELRNAHSAQRCA